MLSADNEQSKADLLSTSLRLIETTAALYSSSNAFIEAFQPMLLVLQSSKTTKLSDVLKVSWSSPEPEPELTTSNVWLPLPRHSRACSTWPSPRVNPSLSNPTNQYPSPATHPNSKKVTSPANDTTQMSSEMQQASSKHNTSKNEKVLFENYEKTIDSWLGKRRRIKQRKIENILPRCVVQRDLSLWSERRRRRWRGRKRGKRDGLEEGDCISLGLDIHYTFPHCIHIYFTTQLTHMASYKLPVPNTPLGPAVLTLALFMIPLAGLLPRSCPQFSHTAQVV
jgi:hypothetical protein